MRIGIDISQIVYEGTGVGTYVREMVREMVRQDRVNEYVLFGSSLRRQDVLRRYIREIGEIREIGVRAVILPLTPALLDILWNQLHIAPIEWFVGPVDVFWSSDWTQPPATRAKLVTTVHDLIALKYPEETHKCIVSVHKRRLERVVASCSKIFCDSEATKRDMMELLGVSEKRLVVVYPGGR